MGSMDVLIVLAKFFAAFLILQIIPHRISRKFRGCNKPMPGALSVAVCSTFSVASAINTLSTRGDSHEQRSGAKPFRVALLLPRKVASALTKFTKASETNKTLTILLRFNEAIIVFDTTGYRLTLTERNELELYNPQFVVYACLDEDAASRRARPPFKKGNKEKN